MFGLDDRRERAALFLQSSTAKTLAGWDAEVMQRWPSDVEVYCQLSWRDVSRAARAWELLDREIRRCGRAYDLAYEESGKVGDERFFHAHDWFMRMLAQHPSPSLSASAGLNIAEVAGPPLTLRMTPSADSWGAFGHAPALTLGYAMAAFGVRFTLERIKGRNVRRDDLQLEGVLEFLRSDAPAFDVLHRGIVVAEDMRESTFRAISRANADGPHDLHVLVQRLAGSSIDLYHAWI